MWVSARFSPDVENEQADAGWDGRSCLAIPNSRAQTRTMKFYIPYSDDHEQDWQPNRMMPSLLKVMTIHTYIP